MRLSVDRHNKHATGQICTRKGYLLTNSEKKYLKEALETGRAVSSEELGLHECGGDRAKPGGIPQSSRNTLPSLLITHRLNSETVEILSPEWAEMPNHGCLTQDCGEMAGVVRGQRSGSQSSLSWDLLPIYWTSSHTDGCTCQAGGSQSILQRVARGQQRSRHKCSIS